MAFPFKHFDQCRLFLLWTSAAFKLSNKLNFTLAYKTQLHSTRNTLANSYCAALDCFHPLFLLSSVIFPPIFLSLPFMFSIFPSLIHSLPPFCPFFPYPRPFPVIFVLLFELFPFLPPSFFPSYFILLDFHLFFAACFLHHSFHSFPFLLFLFFLSSLIFLSISLLYLLFTLLTTLPSLPPFLSFLFFCFQSL